MTLKLLFSEFKRDLGEEMISDLEFLFTETLGVSKLDLQVNEDQISKSDIELMTEKLKKFKKGIPLSYIINSQDFYGYKFFVDKRVLIPRPETECLIDYCLKTTDSEFLKVLDAGAGSGCLGITYLLERKKSFCTFVENSEEAIEVLKINLAKFNIDRDRYQILRSFDELESVSDTNSRNLDLFISNPPYIKVGDERVSENVLSHEPHRALFAEDNGLKYLKIWSKIALNLLKNSRAFAIFEFGLEQDLELKSYALETNLSFEIIKDQYGENRFFKIRGL